MIKTLNKTSEDMIPLSTCKSPRHKIEEARTKTREETKKNRLLSSTAPDISSETPNKPLDTSCTLLKKGSRNKCAPDEAPGTALRENCNMFSEIHKAPDMSSVPPDTPLNRVLREGYRGNRDDYNAPDVSGVTPVKAPDAQTQKASNG
jgi:hypothetical protein